ncbi:GNAT family N-acetyltransferase [Labrenzia sp. PHM005]|uniref:GNAT family N-acetyltransferase n=1 Tax=Labrenzia sp. PHM005 TaxID=2590016 RepID=UPI00113FEE33|nr:GNAT family N-acetyltransferase [Labrenzia sp. PHM005]QDG79377.1 GNAT family N-acetyltransferase [Labrenzia sp. PHM005]
MFEVVDDRYRLVRALEQFVDIADLYKNEIGFWAKASITSAIERNRLLAAFGQGDDKVVGFLIYSGVFPTSKIQAVAVHPDFKRVGVAQLLLDAVIEKLEREGFMSVSARPAEDLRPAQAFYARNGFAVVTTVEGGKARKRRIIVRERTLAVPTLFDVLDGATQAPRTTVAPAKDRIWVLDINVLFDLIKHGRDRYQRAYRVFGAALAGRINVAVTSEFQRELARSKPERGADPIYELASALPTLHLHDAAGLTALTNEVHDLVFVQKGSRQAASVQAMSDSRHVAESIKGNASAFITSDGPLLNARSEIRAMFGLDIAALDEFDDALASYGLDVDLTQTNADGFRITGGTIEQVKPIVAACNAEALLADFERDSRLATTTVNLTKGPDDEVLGCLCLRQSQVFGEPTEVLLFCDQSKGAAAHAMDALLAKIIGEIAVGGPQLVRVSTAQGQSVVSRIALEQGFRPAEGKHVFEKLMLGCPITPQSHEAIQNKLRLVVSGEVCDQLMPASFEGVDLLYENERSEFNDMESFASPALFVANQRSVIIQPIGKSFADQLLGTTNQMNFLDQFGGATKSEKIYVCSGRKRSSYHIGQLVLFYESSRTGGRAAVVAAASVKSVTLLNKEKVTKQNLSQTVLDSVEEMSSTNEVTLVRFSNLLRLPTPVGLPRLKALGAHTGQNFLSATRIATAVGQSILTEGWNYANA